MKMLVLFLLVLPLSFLMGCNDSPVPGQDGHQGRFTDPLRCQSGGEGCDMDWVLSTSSNGFPEHIEIMINDKSIYNECKLTGNVSVSRARTDVNMTINKYETLVDEKEKFSLQITNLGNCYSDKTVFYRHAEQSYKLNQINGVTYVLIKF